MIEASNSRTITIDVVFGERKLVIPDASEKLKIAKPEKKTGSRGTMVKFNKWAFLAGIPLFIILIFIFATIFPSLSAPFGGPSNITGLLTTILTYFYIVLTWMMVSQIAKAQEEERRPYIIVDFEIENRLIWLVVQNIGKMPAICVKISVIPEIIDGTNKRLSDTIFSEPMMFFPPGKKFRSLIKLSHEMLSGDSPLNYKFAIQYSGDNKKRSYSEENTVNLGFHINRLSIFKKDIDDVFSVIEKLNKQLESISNAIELLNKRH